MNTKLLMACAAVAAAASVHADLTVSLGTTRVDSACTNTIVAVPYTDFGGGNVSVSNIVKTANLTAGDMCYVMKNDKNSYEGWELKAGTGGVLYWSPTKVYTVDAQGKLTVTETASAASTTLAPGTALWIVRKGDVTQPFYLCGTYAGSAPTSPVTAGTSESPAYNLIANAGSSAKSVTSLIDNPVNGDEVWIPTNGQPKRCVRKSGAWKGATSETVAPGMGVWYLSKGGSGTVTW